MVVIGLTGSLGSGKTTIAGMFRRRGACVIDADKIAHDVILPGGCCFSSVVKEFGKDILVGGKISRARLAEIVFNDIEKLKKLENIIHPQVIKEIKKEIHTCRKDKNKRVVLMDVPLLFESGLDKISDITIVVRTTFSKQKERIMKSLKISGGEIKKRVVNQMPLHEKIPLSDFVIDNSGSLLNTKRQVGELWEKILKTDKKHLT